MSAGLLIFHTFVASVLLLTWINSLINFLLVRRVRPAAALAKTPSVSILVPARNEARRIERCLRSLAKQNYPRFEVLLLDDHSEDQTSALAKSIGFGHEGSCRILTGAPLPAGWTGKAWACHQLAQAASGDYLLFTDADTVHKPEMLRSAIAAAEQTRASLLSLWPRQITKSLGEKAVVPLLYLAGIGLMPHFLLSVAQRFPRFAARLPRSFLRNQGVANGQFLLFRRESYLAIGGHQSVRSHLVEDVALGREVASRAAEGVRLINADGSLLLECRMYENLAEVWSGFTKNCRAAFEDSVASFIVAGLVQSAVFLSPFALLLLPGKQRWWALAEVLAIYSLRLLYAVRYRGSLVSALLHPLGEVIGLLIALNSWRRSTGAGVEWKGRTYQVVHEKSA
jgi:chlorobactene glucosyltransferase